MPKNNKHNNSSTNQKKTEILTFKRHFICFILIWSLGRWNICNLFVVCCLFLNQKKSNVVTVHPIKIILCTQLVYTKLLIRPSTEQEHNLNFCLGFVCFIAFLFFHSSTVPLTEYTSLHNTYKITGSAAVGQSPRLG